MKSGNLNFLEPSGPLETCNGTALPLPLHCLKTVLILKIPVKDLLADVPLIYIYIYMCVCVCVCVCVAKYVLTIYILCFTK